MKFTPLIFLFTFLNIIAFYQLEKATEPIRFQIKNAGITVDGKILDWNHQISFDPKKPGEAMIKGTANPKSIDTGIKVRDKHLQGRQYFHVEKFPEILISSKKVKENGKGKYLGIFELQIKEIKKEMEIPFTVTTTGKVRTLAGEFTLNRLDFGIGESSIILGDEVKVIISLEF
jgi:polyisoprenoid-binding protein YceI